MSTLWGCSCKQPSRGKWEEMAGILILSALFVWLFWMAGCATQAQAAYCMWNCRTIGKCTYCYSSCGDSLTCCTYGNSTTCY